MDREAWDSLLTRERYREQISIYQIKRMNFGFERHTFKKHVK